MRNSTQTFKKKAKQPVSTSVPQLSIIRMFIDFPGGYLDSKVSHLEGALIRSHV